MGESDDPRRRTVDNGRMSYTLAFWSGADSAECADVYTRLNNGEHVEGWLWSIRPQSPGRWTRSTAGPGRRTCCTRREAVPPRPAFDTFFDAQFVVFTGYHVRPHDINVVIDLMRAHGCRLYDPQTLQRFG